MPKRPNPVTHPRSFEANLLWMSRSKRGDFGPRLTARLFMR
jgi:hypothetical protein